MRVESVSNSHSLIRSVLCRNPPRQFQTQNERLIIYLIIQNQENFYCKPPLRCNVRYYGLGETFHSPFNIHTEYCMLILHLKQDIQLFCSKHWFSQQTAQRHNLNVNKQGCTYFFSNFQEKNMSLRDKHSLAMVSVLNILSLLLLSKS